MTDLLNRAFAEAAKLPKKDQDALAQWLLAELASEKQWENSLTQSRDHLQELADEAMEEHGNGNTEEFDPDSL